MVVPETATMQVPGIVSGLLQRFHFAGNVTKESADRPSVELSAGAGSDCGTARHERAWATGETDKTQPKIHKDENAYHQKDEAMDPRLLTIADGCGKPRSDRQSQGRQGARAA